MSKREPNPELMAHWTLAWRTLGRWQALNARLSAETEPRERDRAVRRAATTRWRATPALVSMARSHA